MGRLGLLDNTWASDLRSLITRAPAPLLAGSLLLASVLLSAGVWSWLRLNNAPRLGTWTDTGAASLITDAANGPGPWIVSIGSGESTVDYTLDPTEFDSPPQVEDGDQVTVWVASVPDSQSTVSYDWRIIKLQSQGGTWTAKDYSYRAAAARADAQPGFGLNYQTVRWVGSISGVLVAMFVLVGVRVRLASAPSGKRSSTGPERLLADATVARFSGSDRLVLGCSVGLALAVLAATVLMSWLRLLAGVFIPG